MNANSKPKTSTVNYWLRDAAEMLASAGIPSALLDAEIILAHTLRKSRTWLHAHSDDEIDARELDIATARLELRLDRTPIAYIIGHKEFYTRLFRVTPSVLIPRPESEEMITLLIELLPTHAKKLLDVGTGSGCLGITAKLELPHLAVTLADISNHALTVAKTNAATLKADVSLLHSDLMSHTPGMFDVILANLPYVDKSWGRSPETDHEPSLALFADRHGRALIEKLIEQASPQLTSGGILLLEADPEQHSTIVTFAESSDFHHLRTSGYIIVLARN